MQSALAHVVSIALGHYAATWTGIEYFANKTLKKRIYVWTKKVLSLYLCVPFLVQA